MLNQAIKRLRYNFQLSIITFMGAFGIFSLTPYAIYRAYHANYTVAIADSFAIFSIIIAVIYAWITNNTVRPGLYLSIVFSATAAIVTINLGINGFFWVYPLILFNFFMVSPGRALLAMLAVLSTLVIYNIFKPDVIFSDNYQMTSFLVTCLLASILSFVFAYRTQHQRDRLQQLAANDPLTGAYNRRVMTKELHRATLDRRSGRAYSLIIMDLDHFKHINDSFGHAIGDQVLIDFVSIIQTMVRENDMLFRHGGEEFALLLPDTHQQGLLTIAEAIQKTIFSKLISPAGAVSVSIGGATLTASDNWEEWIHRADKRLYVAKKMGRNCYKVTD
ncbi:MAG: GGDEF domain-containing protein [Pseudomonas sp.]|nr:GGDEF domain-containing protein [Pseudomonas sp.]